MINATRSQGIASHESPGSQENALDRSMDLNCFTSGSNGTDAGTSEKYSSDRCAQESAARARHVDELQLCSPAAPFQLLGT